MARVELIGDKNDLFGWLAGQPALAGETIMYRSYSIYVSQRSPASTEPAEPANKPNRT